MNFANLPKNTDVANKVVDATVADAAARGERGWLGQVFGGKENVPNNIAAFTVVVGVILLCAVIAFAADGTSFTRKDGVAAALSLVTLALGFLFGRASKR